MLMNLGATSSSKQILDPVTSSHPFKRTSKDCEKALMPKMKVCCLISHSVQRSSQKEKGLHHFTGKKQIVNKLDSYFHERSQDHFAPLPLKENV